MSRMAEICQQIDRLLALVNCRTRPELLIIFDDIDDRLRFEEAVKADMEPTMGPQTRGTVPSRAPFASGMPGVVVSGIKVRIR